MGSLSIWHWVIVAVIVMLLFGGRGKVSELMGDFAKGIKAFKRGMSDEDEAKQAPPAAPVSANEPVRTIPHQTEPAHAAPHAAGAAGDRKAI